MKSPGHLHVRRLQRGEKTVKAAPESKQTWKCVTASHNARVPICNQFICPSAEVLSAKELCSLQLQRAMGLY